MAAITERIKIKSKDNKILEITGLISEGDVPYIELNIIDNIIHHTILFREDETELLALAIDRVRKSSREGQGHYGVPSCNGKFEIINNKLRKIEWYE